jgi:hypothetical protein
MKNKNTNNTATLTRNDLKHGDIIMNGRLNGPHNIMQVVDWSSRGMGLRTAIVGGTYYQHRGSHFPINKHETFEYADPSLVGVWVELAY